MINTFNKALFFGGLYLVLSNPAFGLNPGTVIKRTNSFTFINNEIDNEYFIAPSLLDPRFSGANVWTKLNSNQVSLGYIGDVTWAHSNAYKDMWLENSPVSTPFNGIRCTKATDCPSSGYIQPEYTDRNGFYRAPAKIGIGGGGYGFASITATMYEFLKNLSVGQSQTFSMNYCSTTEFYDPASGGRCTDAKYGAWYRSDITSTKNAQIDLHDLKAFSEIWIASDGKPSLTSNSEYCEYVANSNGGQDIACKMIEYKVEGLANIHSTLYLKLEIDQNKLGFSPSASYVKMKGDAGNTWYNYGTERSFKTLVTNGEGYLSVLFTQNFFKEFLKQAGNMQNMDDVFTFSFRNGPTPESGYYQFSSGLKVDIHPREYSISIKPVDSTQTALEGWIGDNKPIEFKYRVTQSAPRKADIVTANVLGESVETRGQKYCSFKSDDSTVEVAIPAYLSYTNGLGEKIEKYSGCDESQKLDITNALWSETPWDQNNSGYFYQTELNLWFPMSDPVSRFSTDGQDWLGVVHAEGKVQVEAKWIGVNK